MIKNNQEILYTTFSSLRLFYNPSEGKFINLPRGFGTKLTKHTFTKDTDIPCPIYTCMKKEGLLNYSLDGTIKLSSYNKYENYLLLTSIIYKSLSYSSLTSSNNLTSNPITIEDYFIPRVFFSMNTNDKVNNLYTKMLGMDRQNVRDMVKFFVAYGFLKQETEYKIFVKESERVCRTYAVSNQFNRSSVRHQMQNEKVIKKLNDYINKDIEFVLQGDENVNFEGELINDKNISRYTFPSIKELTEVASMMVRNKETNKHGKLYSFGLPDINKSEYVDIEHQINLYRLSMDGTKLLKKREKHIDSDGNVYYSRFYYTLSLMPKWIRNRIKIDGEAIKENDLQSLHPKIVGLKYSEWKGCEIPEVLKGDCHTKLSKELGISRDEAKLINLSWFNSRILEDKETGEFYTVSSMKNKENFKKMDDLAKRIGFFEYLKHVKWFTPAIKKEKSRNTNMSCILMHEETMLMQRIIKRLNTPLIYSYDALYCKVSEYDKMARIMESEMMKMFEGGDWIEEMFKMVG